MVKMFSIVFASMVVAAQCATAAEAVVPSQAPMLTHRDCTAGSPALRAYCRALKISSKFETCREGPIEERLDCLERKLMLQAAEIESLSELVREITTPGVKPLGMVRE